MRIRTLLGSIAASVGVLVIGWQAGTTVIGTTATTTTTTSSGTTSPPDTTTTDTTTTDSGTTATAEPAPVTATYTGTAVNTRFGSVQVQVTVTDGTITDVTALKLTDTDRKSIEISNRAAPILREEVLAAQSANVSNVSGATYTAQAYLASVQSALDQAGL